MVANKKAGAHAVRRKRPKVEPDTGARPGPDPAAEAVATIDRRETCDRRSVVERRVQGLPVPVERRTLERRVKVSRRRQIDPTTCERDYTPDEIEFMSAMDEYKRRNGRMFPTCSEVLEVIKSLGYEKRPKPSDIVPPPVAPPVVAGMIAPSIVASTVDLTAAPITVDLPVVPSAVPAAV
jgi:hypothetical protein